MAGKGDEARPLSVEYTTFVDNWERTFGKHPREQDLDTPPTPPEDDPPFETVAC